MATDLSKISILWVDDDVKLIETNVNLIQNKYNQKFREIHKICTTDDLNNFKPETISFDVIILDHMLNFGKIGLSNLNFGYNVFTFLKTKWPEKIRPTIFFSDLKELYKEINNYTEKGVSQFVSKTEWPKNLAILVAAIEQAYSTAKQSDKLVETREVNESILGIRAGYIAKDEPVETDNALSNIVGDSPAIERVRYLIGLYAKSEETVLIQGETGTGKELVAQALHKLSKRNDFYSRNCSCYPENLIEDELFGHSDGAFTGANKDRKGLFFQADGGTVFLDEIGELPYAQQAKFLRVIQEKKIKPVGSDEELKSDFRLICGTNAPLYNRIQLGTKSKIDKSQKEFEEFRSDLYFRIATSEIFIPPLRERPEDVMPIVWHHLPELIKNSHTKYVNLNNITFDTHAEERLQQHDWPGNVRELRSIVMKIICANDVNPLTITQEMVNVALNKDESESSAVKHAYSDFVSEANAWVQEIYDMLECNDTGKTFDYTLILKCKAGEETPYLCSNKSIESFGRRVLRCVVDQFGSTKKFARSIFQIHTEKAKPFTSETLAGLIKQSLEKKLS